MIHWFLSVVLPKVENTAISAVTGAIVLGCIIAPFKRVWRKVWRALDSIDPDTDSGITKELKQLAQQQQMPPVHAHVQRDDDDVPLAHHGK